MLFSVAIAGHDTTTKFKHMIKAAAVAGQSLYLVNEVASRVLEVLTKKKEIENKIIIKQVPYFPPPS